MAKKILVIKLILLLLGALLINSVPVYAYLDPGAGSMLLQIFIGGVIAAGIIIKAKWYKLKSFFLKNVENKK